MNRNQFRMQICKEMYDQKLYFNLSMINSMLSDVSNWVRRTSWNYKNKGKTVLRGYQNDKRATGLGLIKNLS